MNEGMVEAVFDWISEMRAGNLRFITEVPNISLPHLEAWSDIKAWSEIITFEIEAPASFRGNTVLVTGFIHLNVPSDSYICLFAAIYWGACFTVFR